MSDVEMEGNEAFAEVRKSSSRDGSRITSIVNENDECSHQVEAKKEKCLNELKINGSIELSQELQEITHAKGYNIDTLSKCIRLIFQSENCLSLLMKSC